MPKIWEFIRGRLGIYRRIYSRALGYLVMEQNVFKFTYFVIEWSEISLPQMRDFWFLRDFPAFCGPRGREYLIRDNYCIHMY